MYSGKYSDIDSLANAVLECCQEAAKNSFEAVAAEEKKLGKPSKQRVPIKRQGKIGASEFKKEEKRDDEYREYADKIIEEACRGAKDFSIFEKQESMFDGASGTQMVIRQMGTNRNILN